MEWGTQASSGVVLGRRASSVCLPSSAADMVRRTCGLEGLLEGRVGAKGSLGIGFPQDTSQASRWPEPPQEADR